MYGTSYVRDSVYLYDLFKQRQVHHMQLAHTCPRNALHSPSRVCNRYCTCVVVFTLVSIVQYNVDMESQSGLSEPTDCSVTEHLRLEEAKSPLWAYFGLPAHNGKFLGIDKKRQTSPIPRSSLRWKLAGKWFV